MAQTVEDSLVVRMEASLAKFERQMARGKQAANNAALGAEKAWQRSGAQITANANRAATGISRLSNVSGRGRFVLQNTANQIGDMAVQLEGGTNAARVMAQQLPQLFGGLGALGGALGILGPLLGTVAAVGIPAVAMFAAMGGEADEAQEKVKTFADKLAEAESALRNAEAAMAMASKGGLDELEEKYGVVTEKVHELAKELAEIERRAATIKIGQVLDDALGDAYNNQLDRVFGTVGKAIAQAGTDEAQEEVEAIRQGIADLQAEMAVFEATNQRIPAALTRQLTEMQEELAAVEGRVGDIGSLADEMIVSPETLTTLATLRDRLEEARLAGDFLKTADTISEMRSLLEEAGVEIEQSILDGMTQVEDLARQAAKQFQDGASAASGIAPALSPAVTEAQRLVDTLRNAVDAMFDLRQQGAAALETAQIRFAHQGDAVGTAGALAAARFDRQTAAIREGGFGSAAEQAAYDAQRAAYIRDAEKAARLTEAMRPSSKSGGSSGGGRAAAVTEPDFFASSEAQIQSLQRQIEMVGKSRSEIAELTTKYKLLDEAKAKGLALDEQQTATGETLRQQIDRQAEAVGRLTEQEERAIEQAAYFIDLQEGMKEGFLDAIVEGENFAGVMEDVAKSLAKAALQAALFGDGPLAGLFGLGGDSGGLLGAMGIKLPFHAAGTEFSHGGAAIVGERGPEVVNLPRGARVYSSERSRGMLGGTNVEFRVVNNSQSNVSQREERGPDGRRVLIAEVNDAATKGELTGIQARYQLKNPKVRR